MASFLALVTRSPLKLSAVYNLSLKPSNQLLARTMTTKIQGKKTYKLLNFNTRCTCSYIVHSVAYFLAFVVNIPVT